MASREVFYGRVGHDIEEEVSYGFSAGGYYMHFHICQNRIDIDFAPQAVMKTTRWNRK
jgi:hypothetical protein